MLDIFYDNIKYKIKVYINAYRNESLCYVNRNFYSIKTIHNTYIFLLNNKMMHARNENCELFKIFLNIVDDNMLAFYILNIHYNLYIKKINQDFSVELSPTPTYFPYVKNSDGSIAIKINSLFLSANKSKTFKFEQHNKAWEHFLIDLL